MFVDFQKTFDTVDHKILLHKLKYYDITEWFKLYLSNPKHFVSINGYNSDLMPVDWGLPQGSVPWPFLSLIYSNDLHKAIQYCKVNHFVNDTNLFHKSKLVKKASQSWYETFE